MIKRKFHHMPEWLTAGLAFVYYGVISIYKFMEAPLWGDEVVEYYCSILEKGPLWGITQATTMYGRMLEFQLQPPLYNWVMAPWVTVSNDEFWLRFSSYLFCFAAVLGIYAVIRRLADRWWAAASVIVFSSIYTFQYFVREVAEYALLFPILIWLIYFFVRLLTDMTLRDIIIFSLLCVAAMYTQYGAVFLVVPLAIQALFYSFCCKNWKGLKQILGAYAVAGAGAGIPLVCFFLLPQSSHPVSTFHYARVAELEQNLLYDFGHNLLITFRWLLIDADRDADKLTWFIWGIILVLLVFGAWGSKNNRILRYLMGAALSSYLLYYVCTIFKVYGYGWFGTRHVLFYLPILYITLVYCVYNTWNRCAEKIDRNGQKGLFPRFLQIGILMTAVIYCCYGAYRLHNHWWKSDERAVASWWYNNDCIGKELFVDHKQRITFLYYLQQNENFEEDCLINVYSNPLAESEYYTAEEWAEYFALEVYPDGMPENFYILTGDFNGLMEAVEQMGYQIQSVVDTTTNLFYCYR